MQHGGGAKRMQKGAEVRSLGGRLQGNAPSCRNEAAHVIAVPGDGTFPYATLYSRAGKTVETLRCDMQVDKSFMGLASNSHDRHRNGNCWVPTCQQQLSS